MRVLHVIATMNPATGGMCQAVRTMIVGLKDLGISNEVVSLDLLSSFLSSDERFHLHTLGTRPNSWGYSSRLHPWLLKNLSCFEVVIVHGLWQYYSFAVLRVLKSYKKGQVSNSKTSSKKIPKVFIMPHGMLDPYFQLAKERKLKAIRNSIYWKFIESKVINQVDGILFTCDEERRLAPMQFATYKPKQEMVVGLGVEHPPPYSITMKQAFDRECTSIQDHPYIIFLGRIHSKKGVDLLLRAYEKAYEKNRRKFPKLVVAGPGIDSFYGRKIKKLVSTSKTLSNNVHFVGMLTGNEKWGALYGCEAFILPSHQENFGVAVVEALACSKVVLISNQVNIWKEIKALGGGLVYDDTEEGVLQLLEQWTELNNEEKLDMSKNAKVVYEKLYTVDAAAKCLRGALVESLAFIIFVTLI